MELFFLAFLFVTMAFALGSGYPVAFSLPGAAIISISGRLISFSNVGIAKSDVPANSIFDFIESYFIRIVYSISMNFTKFFFKFNFDT